MQHNTLKSPPFQPLRVLVHSDGSFQFHVINRDGGYAEFIRTVTRDELSALHEELDHLLAADERDQPRRDRIAAQAADDAAWAERRGL